MNRHAGPDSTGRCEHPIMAKPEVRRALAYAVPHEDIHKKVYFGGGHVIKTITPRIYPNSTDKFWPYHENLEKAKMLLAEAGYPDGFDMTISYDMAISEMEETCTLIKKQLREDRDPRTIAGASVRGVFRHQVQPQADGALRQFPA